MSVPDYKYHVKHRYPQSVAYKTQGNQWVIIDHGRTEPEPLCLPHRYEPEAWYYAYCTMIQKYGVEGN